MLAGARLVQIGTYNYTNPNIGVLITNKLESYCKKNKIINISDIIGEINYHE